MSPSPDEMPEIWSQLANRQVGWINRGGRLHLTTAGLEFRPTRVERRLRALGWSAPLVDLAGAEVTGRSLNVFAAGPRRRLRVRLKDGGVEVFVINRGDSG